MNTKMRRFRWFHKNLCISVLWTKVVLALEELILIYLDELLCQSCVPRKAGYRTVEGFDGNP